MPKLEIAAVTLADAVAAQDGGADSIEISRDLSVGGLTPDFDLVRRARDAVQIAINVMIRPHAREYFYTEREIEQILDEARKLAPMGIDGVVFGALTPDRHLDLALIAQVAQAAVPLPVTVHRALDESLEPEQALAELNGIAPRVLTAGPAPTAWAGRIALAEWVKTYGDWLRFVVSGGLTIEQIPEMLATVQAHEYHFGSAARTGGAVDPAKVHALRALLDGALSV
jgi:copper homeostasis protein